MNTKTITLAYTPSDPTDDALTRLRAEERKLTEQFANWLAEWSDLRRDELIEEAEAITCPSCAGYIPNDDEPGKYPGAVSRTDNVTEVCSACGDREAMQDMGAWEAAGKPDHYVQGATKDDWVRPDLARPLSYGDEEVSS